MYLIGVINDIYKSTNTGYEQGSDYIRYPLTYCWKAHPKGWVFYYGINKIMIKDFVGVFPNAASKEYCQRCIDRFDLIANGLPGHGGKVLSRQEMEKNVPQMSKDSDVYNICEDVNDKILLSQTDELLNGFDSIVWKCYDEYSKKYGILNSIARHQISPYIKIQKYKPSQGYHMWHEENSRVNYANRMLVVALYLNTVKEGGETEFLYQSMRVKPEQGTLLIHPGGFTHTHRGNPPLKGVKYLMNTWIISVE